MDYYTVFAVMSSSTLCELRSSHFSLHDALEWWFLKWGAPPRRRSGAIAVGGMRRGLEAEVNLIFKSLFFIFATLGDFH